MPEMSGKTKIAIEDDPRKLLKLSNLLSEYALYIRDREKQPLAAELVVKVKMWVDYNRSELEGQ